MAAQTLTQRIDSSDGKLAFPPKFVKQLFCVHKFEKNGALRRGKAPTSTGGNSY